MTQLEAARLNLINLVHAADRRHEIGEVTQMKQLWNLVTACIEVARLQGRPWALQDLSSSGGGTEKPKEAL